jgi:hypothetical protein
MISGLKRTGSVTLHPILQEKTEGTERLNMGKNTDYTD